MERKIKTIKTEYIVKVNQQPVAFCLSLKNAREFVKTLLINDDVNLVEIVKITTNECLLDSYTTKTTKILVASELDNELTF